jgi:hypothetical protein
MRNYISKESVVVQRHPFPVAFDAALRVPFARVTPIFPRRFVHSILLSAISFSSPAPSSLHFPISNPIVYLLAFIPILFDLLFRDFVTVATRFYLSRSRAFTSRRLVKL